VTTLNAIRHPGETSRQLVDRLIREARLPRGAVVRVCYRCSVEVAGGRGVAFVAYHTETVRVTG
jgi:hypothetical protein